MNADWIIVLLCVLVLLQVLRFWLHDIEWDQFYEDQISKERGWHRYYIRKAKRLDNSNRTLKGHIARLKKGGTHV